MTINGSLRIENKGGSIYINDSQVSSGIVVTKGGVSYLVELENNEVKVRKG